MLCCDGRSVCRRSVAHKPTKCSSAGRSVGRPRPPSICLHWFVRLTKRFRPCTATDLCFVSCLTSCSGSHVAATVECLPSKMSVYLALYSPPTLITTNESVRSTTGCLPVSERVKSFRLRFFGHLARLNPEEDHHCVIAAALRPPSDWRRPAGRPKTTWLRTIVEDLQSQNFGVHTAWRKAKERDTWHQVVSTATLCLEFATKKKNKINEMSTV